MDNRYDNLLRDISEKQLWYTPRTGGQAGGTCKRDKVINPLKGEPFTSRVFYESRCHLFNDDAVTQGVGYHIEIEAEGVLVEQVFIPEALNLDGKVGRQFEAAMLAVILEAKHLSMRNGDALPDLIPAIIDRALDDGGMRADTYGLYAIDHESFQRDPEAALIDYAKKAYRRMYGSHMPRHAQPQMTQIDKCSSDRWMEMIVQKWMSTQFQDSSPLGEAPEGYRTFEKTVGNDLVVALACIGSPEAAAEFPRFDDQCISVVLGDERHNNPDFNSCQIFYADPSKPSTWFKALSSALVFEAQQSRSLAEAKSIIGAFFDIEGQGVDNIDYPDALMAMSWPCLPEQAEENLAVWDPVFQQMLAKLHPNLKYESLLPDKVYREEPSLKP